MLILFISDTHGKHRELINLPDDAQDMIDENVNKIKNPPMLNALTQNTNKIKNPPNLNALTQNTNKIELTL